MANETGKFRRKRNNFAQVSNVALMDNKLSMKAKGLYAMIQSMISIPDFILYKQTLINASKEGRDSFNAAWTELKDLGYLVQYRIQHENGTFSYEYELLDVPKKESKENDLTGDGFSVYGLSVSGSSVDGKAVDINNTKESNTEENNINKNNISNNNENNIYNSSADFTDTDSVDVKQRNEYILKADKLAKQNLQKNKQFEALKDPEVETWGRDESQVLDFAKEFDEKYAGKSTKCYMYDLSDIMMTYLRFASAFRSNKIPLAAKDLMDEVLASFVSPKDMLAILELSPSRVNKIYLCALKIAEDNGEIHDRQAYLAQIIRSIASGKEKEGQGE